MRYGASVSTSSRSSGRDGERLAQAAGVLEGHRAGEGQPPAAARRSARPSPRRRRSSGRRPARAARRPRARRSTSSWASRSWMTSALPCRLRHLDVRAERRLLRRRGPPARCGSGPARSRRRRVRRGRPASASISARALVERAGRRQQRRLVGVQRDAGHQLRRTAVAVSTAHRAPGRSQPICTMRGTPTAVDRGERVVDRQPVVRRVGDVEVAVRCRRPAPGSGSGAGGRSRGPLTRPPRARVGPSGVPPVTPARALRAAGRAARPW